MTLFSNCQVYFRNQIPSRVKPEAIRIHLVIGPDLAGVLGAGGREEERVRERERERETERDREPSPRTPMTVTDRVTRRSGTAYILDSKRT